MAPGTEGTTLSLQVARDDLRRVRVAETSPAGPGPGEALFRVERFGVSANNVTYALLGDRLRYWDLFPAETGWGQIPVWGYLRAVASRSGEVEPGRRAFGLCPMSTRVLMRPDRGDAAGFRDASAARSAVSGVYNAYFWADGDSPGSRIGDLLVVLHPLFWLSFTLDSYLAENGRLTSGAVITSASSKAAIGLAHLLRGRGVPTVGLTSPRHVSFVKQTSEYGAVAGYDQLGAPRRAHRIPDNPDRRRRRPCPAPGDPRSAGRPAHVGACGRQHPRRRQPGSRRRGGRRRGRLVFRSAADP